MFVPVTINRATCVICKGKCPESHLSYKGYSLCKSKCADEIVRRLGKIEEAANAASSRSSKYCTN